MRQTPLLNAKGFYEFNKPWDVKQGVIYECIAIRSFSDIYKLGVDVYEQYYKPVGLVIGKTVDGSDTGFNFEAEAAKTPNIITLRGSDGSMIYIPDTYITKVPTTDLEPYSHVVLGVSLGPLPDAVNLDNIKRDVAAMVAARIGINATVHVCRSALVSHPTNAEHLLLEKARKVGLPPVIPTLQAELDTANQELVATKLKIKTLESVIIEHGMADNL